MTEVEWLTCHNPQKMLKFLREERGATLRTGGRRQLRLFACACLRGIWALLRKEGSRQAVDTAERFADALASDRDLADAMAKARGAQASEGPEIGKSPYWQSSEAAVHAVAKRFSDGDHASVTHASLSAAFAWANERAGPGQAREHSEKFSDEMTARQAVHADWLRDIIGSPFQPVVLDPTWLTWNDSTIPTIARKIYDDRAFAHLPILADALEEAGCDNADILAHCRSGGEHVRGCWVLDLLLGKK